MKLGSEMYNHETNNYSCPFCRMMESGLSVESDVVYETEYVFACLSLRHHKNSGPTVLVIPKKHVENIYDISEFILSEVSSTSKLIALKMRELWNIEGITMWQNNEPSGSQDVWHFHSHVKCRLKNDKIYCGVQVRTDKAQRVLWATELRQYLSAT